jgi:hypothetical protein
MVKFIFDVESDGLYGEGFAFGCIVVKDNEIIEKFSVISKTEIKEKWVIDNVLPNLEDKDFDKTVETNKELRNEFYKYYCKTKEKYKAIEFYSDCNFPVETNFLADIARDDLNNRAFNMPFPLIDIATSKNIDINRKENYEKETGKRLREHNPVDDCIASAYFAGGENNV